jgi:hypothetical protein
LGDPSKSWNGKEAEEEEEEEEEFSLQILYPLTTLRKTHHPFVCRFLCGTYGVSHHTVTL